jgi:hypothetical protein
VVIAERIGSHDRPAIEAALADLAAEGLAERDAGDPLIARLPVASVAAAG